MNSSFFVYVYYKSLHVSSTHVLIIRRINCISTTSSICHCTQVTLWYSGLGSTPTCIPDGHLHKVAYTRYIDIINSPDDERMSARNRQRFGTNIHEKRTVLQVGHLQKLYLYAQSTKHKIVHMQLNPLNAELNPICYLLALL